MKKAKLKIFAAALLVLAAVQVFGQERTPPVAASQAEVNAGTIHTKFVAPDTLTGLIGAPGSVVTNYATNVNLGLTFSTGNYDGTTNPVYVINAFEFPQAGGKYAWSVPYAAYTNSAATNIQLFYDATNATAWEIGTQRNDINLNQNFYYQLTGTTAVPTNSISLGWIVGNDNTGSPSIALNIVTFVNGTNISGFNFLNGYPSFYIPNIALNAPISQNQYVTLLASFYTNSTPLQLVTVGADPTYPAMTGRITLWSWLNGSANLGLAMFNCFRMAGVSGDWGLNAVPDARTAILKSAGDTANKGFGSFLLETHAAGGGPGKHGTFNNPLSATTNGTIAIGDLTDVADNNNNTLKPPFWLTIYGDGSQWVTTNGGNGVSALAAFGVPSQKLIATPVGGAYEFDGTNWYFTDNSLRRWQMAKADTNQNLAITGTFTGNGSGLTNGFANGVTYTNFLFATTYTNTTTRSAFVSANGQCSPTTTVTAKFALATSPTGTTFTTNAAVGLEADTIFTTVPHGWYQTTAIVPPGGIWKVIDITGDGAVMITNSYWQTLQ